MTAISSLGSEAGSNRDAEPAGRRSMSRRLVLIGLACGIVVPSPALAEETIHYRLLLQIEWSAASHPHEFPPAAHFSDLVGATHDARYVMFGDGLTASSGLELLAENGRASILLAELEEAKRRNRIGASFAAEGTYTLPGTMAAEFVVTKRHSRVSFVTMIAPSPDWFTGLAGVDLAPGGTWTDSFELPLWAWDAGTDSGTTYTAPDLDTQPRKSVRLLSTPHVLGASGLIRLGAARFVRSR